MSGGFFRGTSADQDTRFSNKQAKLLKSQKFAPELEHLVDMTKVNMDVMRPWITRKVTELLGFEDEVLINFIHGLLEAKKVNGKEIQIQITGFMEKNTGKFMKELWTLLLSAQKNASGVPQQFLDAKEEELLKKKAESDRITSEIQRKKDKESKDIMEERLKKLDGRLDAKDNDAASDPTLKSRDSGHYIQDGKQTDRNGVRARNRGSPARAISKSFSNSRSYSRSPKGGGRSISSERIQRSSRRQSISPRRRSPQRSPHRRPSYSRRRSRSSSSSPIRRGMHSPFRRRRTPSPVQRRRTPSPVRRRSPSPVRRRRSPSPVRRRRSPPSPVRRRRSPPSPVRQRRSPYPARRRRSPSPVRRRRSPSPIRRRRSPSPMNRRRSPSPIRRRSPSPLQQRSPSMRRRSPSPMRRIPLSRGRRSSSPMQSPVMRRYDSRTPRRRSPSPLQHRSPVSGKKRSASASPKRSPSQDEWSSQSPVRVSPSPVRRRTSPRHQRSPLQSSMGRVRVQKILSPEVYQPSSPLRSVQRDKNGKASGYKSQDSMSTPDKSPIRSISPPQARSKTSSKNRRERKDPKSNSSEKKSRHSPVSKRIGSSAKFHDEDEFYPERAASHLASDTKHYDNNERNKKGQDIKCDKSSGKGGESPGQQKSPMNKEFFSGEKLRDTYAAETKKTDDKDQINSKYAKSSDQHHKSEGTQDLVGKVDHVNQSASYDSVSEESDKHRRDGKDRRKHKRSERKVVSSDENDSYDSELEDRKEAKRRKKEEKKKLRKEEKHRKREERRRKREERHAEKLKMKSKPGYISDNEEAERRDGHQSDDEEEPYDPKKLEIELRNKALESLKAKKSMNN
ncbi:SR-rich pre-mRNA splicing activator [Medicago truncatula]|uniref:SR-rich pre-mRNA splicing activator n=1 Tax=Medicago truncatula TaxID=3880 RepID=A0A072UKA5_MEDTR|nr:SR-rich pre-mRNA splicing activator [Medicago truncatula]